MLIKIYTRVKGNTILAIVDTEACMLVITKPLVVALGLPYKKLGYVFYTFFLILCFL